MKKIYLLIFTALFSLTTMAQYKKADRLFDRWEYYRAAKIYEKKANKNSSAEAYVRLGECYQKMNLYKEALAAYDIVNSKNPYITPEFYLNYGLILQNNGKDAQAKEAFKKYSEAMQNDPRGDFFAAAIDIAREDRKYDEPITIKNVGALNSENADLCPVLYKDGIVFTSSRKTSGHGKIYGWTGANYLDLYYAKKGSDNLNFTDVTPFGGKKISKKYHDGPACFSKNFDVIYISRVQKDLRGSKKRTLGIETNKIFVSTMKDEKWTKNIPFQYNSDTYSVSNPFLTADGSRLYFVSDMPGGLGNADIWYCNRQGDAWSNPINMGANINTFNSERYPSVDSEGNLYFASDGYQGFGGLDICVSINNNGTFQKAIPMKAPFNSSYDDYGVTFIEDGRIGYISSNRYENGKGDDDILYFNLSEDNVPATLVTSVYTMGYKQKPKAEVAPKVMFAVNSPENIPLERRVRETFPIRNYIFFDLESTKIPDRYVLLTKDEVKNFKETNLEVFTPKTLSGRSTRQMIAYYNILNILGNRMGENPNSTIVLVGSSEKGVEDGKLMAESVKKYLVDVFQIKSTRINIEGRVKPKLPSEQPNAANDLVMLREGDRRVSVESDAPAILMEFQSGPDVPLKPVEIAEVQVAPMDSYITIQADGGKNPFTSWSLEVSDEKGKTQVFGPYYQNQISIPGKSILGTRSNGDYKFVMIGKTANETILKKDTTVHLVLWIPDVKEEGIRYSVLYEYDDSKSIYIYEKYLSEVVVPIIPVNGKVIIHGYTDIVGDANYNLLLSTARANDVKKIMETALSKTNRKDVKFEVRGFGENASLSPFENKFPEERFYNRTVIIDIIPAKSK